jgi:kynureninase
VGLAHDRQHRLALLDTPLVELTDYRERFPILASTTYLINHSLGAMPAEAARRLERFAHEWATRGARAWGEGWWDSPVRTGDLVGSIVGAPAGSTVMHQNVTVAEAIVLSCFDLKPPRNRIVFEAGLFPSVRYVQQAWSRFGAEVVVCDDAEAVVDAIDERTLLVPISHVLYKTAEIQPIERIVERAHDVGAHVCLDAYQSAGAVPLDVTALGIAFCVGGSVKWLCGGPGAGWLYVRPDLAEQLEPAFAGWQGHARPFAFEDEMEHAPGAARFLTGTPVVAANYAASAGYEIIEEIGVDVIRANSMRQTALLVGLVDEAGFELTSPRDPEIRGGSVVFRVPDFQAVHAELAARDIICDYRPDAGLRFGPHFFTTDDEIRFAVEQVTEILASGAHKSRAGATAGY